MKEKKGGKKKNKALVSDESVPLTKQREGKSTQSAIGCSLFCAHSKTNNNDTTSKQTKTITTMRNGEKKKKVPSTILSRRRMTLCCNASVVASLPSSMARRILSARIWNISSRAARASSLVSGGFSPDEAICV